MSQVPQAASTGNIVGSWYATGIGPPGLTAVATFLDNGTYFAANTGNSAVDPTGRSGMEFGTYTWSAATGAVTRTTQYNTDGTWGLSDSLSINMTVTGNSLLFADNVSTAGFTQILSPAASIVGSWKATNIGGHINSVATFLANGTFFVATYGNSALEPTGRPGLESGTYTWNAATGAFSYVLQNNTDGVWGFSNSAITRAVLGNATLTLSGSESLSLSRVSNLTGTSGSSQIGTAAADTFTSTAGNDAVNGGAGIDTLVMLSARAGYTLAASATGYTVTDRSGNDGVDALVSVERLKFSDTRVALDVSGNAGTTAKVLGAVFGRTSLTNKDYVGTGLSLLDGGMSYASLMQLAINARLGANAGNTAVVDLLYTNVVGVAPGAAERALYVGLLDSGAHTQGSLGVLAADTAQNQSSVNLVGLAATGIEFNPV